MDRWLGKTAVVTGAGSGMGEAITCALLRNGVNVVALEVLKERLAKLDADCKRERFPGRLYTICCDITREDEINAAFSQIETLGGVDIMVNNAGIIETSRIIDSNRKTFERILNTNVLAFAVCMNKAVCSMRKRNNEGHIFNLNSIVSHHRIPNNFFECNMYFSSKHASLALTNTVRREVGKIKAPIRVTSISPGTVKTNIVAHEDSLKNFFEKAQYILPEDIADAIIYALGTRPSVQITELTIQPTGELM
ncbi:PREDICTED: dehydrogenase/reductase SDR family member 11-like [Atta cephalotes]|uniref:Dehydrogenase n=1 Tax=Atta cephalotes TaxID=12957 RepID=A0A158NFC3_ATTCE|nr:PREDICTED: dehydrogenase/reductase SDR family member 11-like [Atta cephalotes]